MGMKWGDFSNLLGVNSAEQRIPINGEFELTTRCNLKCRMCNVCRDSKDKTIIMAERSAREWIKIAKEAREAGLLFLLMTGGEVFLRNDFELIYNELTQMGFIISIYSNGTMITPRIAQWLGSKPPSQIDISLYGGSKDTYEKLCGNANVFDTAIRGIDLLIEQGINVQLRTAMIKGNREDFNSMTEIAERRGIVLSIVDYISPRREGDATHPEVERLTPREWVEFEMEANQYYQRNVVENQRLCILVEEEIKEKEKQFLSKHSEHPFQCSSGKNSFRITWDGRMIPCALLDTPATFPFVKGFRSAWEELVMNCEHVPVCKACNMCSLKDYCSPCPARLKIETGSFEMPAQYLCELAHETYLLHKKII